MKTCNCKLLTGKRCGRPVFSGTRCEYHKTEEREKQTMKSCICIDEAPVVTNVHDLKTTMEKFRSRCKTIVFIEVPTIGTTPKTKSKAKLLRLEQNKKIKERRKNGRNN